MPCRFVIFVSVHLCLGVYVAGGLISFGLLLLGLAVK